MSHVGKIGKFFNIFLIIALAVSSLNFYTYSSVTAASLPLQTADSVISASGSNQAADLPGQRLAGQSAVFETTAQIMQRAATTPEVPSVADFETDDLVKAAKSQPESSNANPENSNSKIEAFDSSIIRNAPQTGTISFTGATLADTNVFPPDTMGTVGPSQFIVAVNGRIRSFNKNTGVADGVLDVAPTTFFASVLTPQANTTTTTPRIRFDRFTNRWILLIRDVPGGSSTTANRIMLAVSDAASNGVISPATVWSFYYIFSNKVMVTTTLGVDANALYIGANITNNGSYSASDGFVVQKSSILNGGPIVSTNFANLVTSGNAGPYAPQGVDNFDANATEGYFIGVDNVGYGLLVLRRVSNPGTTNPTISGNINLTVPDTTGSINVPHKGNTGGSNGNLSGYNDRLYSAVIRNGRLWTAHNIQVNSSGTASTSGGRNGVRWYEIQSLTGSPSLVQSGTIYDSASSNPVSYWLPSIMVSGQGHTALGFSSAGNNAYINAATAGRLKNDTLGTTQSVFNYTNSSTAYNPAGDAGGSGGRRWGSYSYTSLDPEDDMTMWTIQQFCDALNSYGVRVVKLLAPPPATPSAVNPNSVQAGLSSVAVTVTGTSSNGSGFYDPGAGFSKRLIATVSGGVSVNSLTYLSPTQVVLNLNTAGALPGLKDITITNPDGQSATGTGLLTVTPPPLPTVSVNSVSLSEGNSGTTNAVFTVSLSGAAEGTTTVAYATADGTATVADNDYVVANGTLTFPAGVTSQSITVTVNGDTKYEPDEIFNVTLSNPSGLLLGNATGTGTIVNDDNQPQLSIANTSVNEGNSGTTSAVFTVTLSAASGLTATVSYATADGTATVADNDYVAASGTLIFPPGVNSRLITVTVNGDTKNESNETFTVNLANPANATVAVSSATGTIVNDDNVINIADTATGEGNSGTTFAPFLVTLSSANDITVTVNYATADGTATVADNDYAAASGTLVFPPGSTTQVINVVVNGDTKLEPDEIFTVTLTNPTGATLGKSSATATIFNDDSLPTVNIANTSVIEGNSGTTNAVFTVTLSAAGGVTATVDYTTADETATVADNDYVPTSGTLVFPPGVTSRLITVTVNGDTKNEPNETFKVILSNPFNLLFGANSSAVGTILTDESCNPLTVTSAADDGTCGTLRTAAFSAVSGQTISLNLPTGTIINLTNGFVLKNNVALTSSAGCASGPAIVLQGPGANSVGITLSGNNSLFGIAIRGFGGPQLTALGRGNLLRCVTVSKN